jgi:hypothetical protein
VRASLTMPRLIAQMNSFKRAHCISAREYNVPYTHPHTVMSKKKSFESYPQRHITLSDEEWEQLKKHKEIYGGNWNKFIKHINQLLEGKEKQWTKNKE